MAIAQEQKEKDKLDELLKQPAQEPLQAQAVPQVPPPSPVQAPPAQALPLASTGRGSADKAADVVSHWSVPAETTLSAALIVRLCAEGRDNEVMIKLEALPGGRRGPKAQELAAELKQGGQMECLPERVQRFFQPEGTRHDPAEKPKEDKKEQATAV